MLRDPALVPLSRQHQHALALCVRIERGRRSTADELRRWQLEIVSLFDQEIRFHFVAEERILFPAAEQFAELRHLISDLRREHVALRTAVDCAASGTMDASGLTAFASLLSSHIRREERELFEGMQKLFSSEELHDLGVAVDEDFRASGLPASLCEIRPNR
jgi:hemerythrin-like domain-containing protein